MRIRWTWLIILTSILVILFLAPVFATQQGGQRAPEAPTGPAPRLPNGKPDLRGLWQRPYVPDMTKNANNQVGMSELPFTPAGEAEWKKYDASHGDYTGSCMPFGLIRSMNSPDPIQIMQDDNNLALLYEQNTWFHLVYLDGRGHPEGRNLVPSWFGHSVGRWEGDTLVVDTAGFNGYTRLDTIGHPHSDQLHVVETFQRTDAGHITYTITIDDPKTYTKPWKNSRVFTLRKDWEILEYSCEENNKDLFDGHLTPWRPPQE